VAGGNGAVVFPSETCREIFRLSHGIPREINTLASSALIAAYADGSPSVTLAHLAAASQEGDFRSVLSGPTTRPIEPEPTPAPPPAPAPPPISAAPPRPAPVPQHIPAPRRTPEISPTPVWPPLPQPVAAPRAAAPQPPVPSPPPAPPAPPRPPADPYAPPRERGEISKGLMAAMRRADVPQPPPPPAPPAPRPSQFMVAPRAQFAPPQGYAPSPPAPPAPIPFPRPSAGPPAPQPHPPGTANLPPRLRERLEQDLARTEATKSPLRNWLIAVSVLATLGILLILMQRFGAIDVPILRGAAGSRASGPANTNGPEGAVVTPGTQDPTAALIDSLKHEVEVAKRSASLHTASTPGSVAEPTRRVVTPATQVPARATTAGTGTHATPKRTTRTPDSSGASASAESSNGPHFGVGVAEFLDADRASTEKDRLSHDTALPAVVLPFNDEGTTMYRVVLGRWSTQADAESAASALMERGLISEANVVRIPHK
jgi:hypothetical protein